jgi:hypothetical protein
MKSYHVDEKTHVNGEGKNNHCMGDVVFYILNALTFGH